MGGLSLPQILQAEESQGIKRGHKAIINIFLPGGPPHQDMWDLKPNAPKEIRGELKEISTNVPGIRIGELFPRMAKMMDKFTVIRSMVGAEGGHDAWQCQTGRGSKGNQPPGGWPSMGAVLSKLHGAVKPGVPPFVGLAPNCGHKQWGDPGTAGFLGPAHSPFLSNKDGNAKEDMKLNGLTIDRLGERKSLLDSFDTLRRDVDNTRAIEGLDVFNQQALAMLTSSRLAEALNLEKEDPKLRERYGMHPLGQNLLLARRMVEAGVRFVTVNGWTGQSSVGKKGPPSSSWDMHGGNMGMGNAFGNGSYGMGFCLPRLDQALAGLFTDLKERGMMDNTLVVVTGEFGRTPKVLTQKPPGRQHWPKCFSSIIAGCGIAGGHVYGKSDKTGSSVISNPVRPEELAATIYHALDIPLNEPQNNTGIARPITPGKPVLGLFG